MLGLSKKKWWRTEIGLMLGCGPMVERGSGEVNGWVTGSSCVDGEGWTVRFSTRTFLFHCQEFVLFCIPFLSLQFNLMRMPDVMPNNLLLHTYGHPLSMQIPMSLSIICPSPLPAIFYFRISACICSSARPNSRSKSYVAEFLPNVQKSLCKSLIVLPFLQF